MEDRKELEIAVQLYKSLRPEDRRAILEVLRELSSDPGCGDGSQETARGTGG